MKKLLICTLVFLLFFTLVLPWKVFAIDNLTVTVNPTLRDSLAEYDISFVTGADLIGGKDDIIIQFPQGTKLPCSCPHNWHLNFFEINGYQPSRAGKVTDIPNSMYLCIPGGITIKKGETVNVVIKPYANIWNPSKPGNYQLTLWTTKEGKVKSNVYKITSTHLKNLKVKVFPNTSGLIASYEIYFTTGEKGSLSNGQHVYVEFPEGTKFPSTVKKNDILLNDKVPEDVKISNNVIDITISHSINKNRDCILNIKSDFGISNPNEGGTKELYIWTDNEPEKVEAQYEIKAQETVSTFLSTVPAVPDGMSGYFKTKPVITLTGETNSGKEVKTFYKIDNGSYAEYSAPFSVKEGIHTIYYYSVAGELKEQPHSVIFKVDTIPPDISIDFPPESPFYTGESTVHISGKVSEKSELIVNKKVVPLKKDLNFSTVVTLSPGMNTVKITAVDIAGNSSSKEIRIVFDTTVPELKIISPQNWEKILTKEIEVRGSVSPANSEVYMNGKKIDVLENGNFDYSFTPKSSGNLILIKLKAVYPYSKKSITKVITVVYSPNLPEVLLTINKKSALVNGKVKEMDVAPFIDKHTNRTLVPVRFVTEFLGGTVQWDGNTRTVTIEANSRIVKLTIGKKAAYVNGEPFKLDQPAIIVHNRTFVPLRFVAEALGFNVKWNGKNKTITILP